MTLTDRTIWRTFRYHSRTFSLATRLLPRPVQLPVATLYLFCRHIDTLADERVREIGAAQTLVELDSAEEALRQTLAGCPPEHGLWQRLAEVHRHFHLNAPPLFELIEGARWDLTGQKVESEADLLYYSNLVGGCVGVMMLPFLVPTPATAAPLEAAARDLGIAMQITNILRDVGEDYRELGRLYLPAEALARYGIKSHALAPSARYAALVEEMMVLAETRYTRSLHAIRILPPPVQRGITAAARMYREILNEVRAHHYDNISRRAVVKPARKLRLVVQDDYDRRKQALLGAHPTRRIPA